MGLSGMDSNAKWRKIKNRPPNTNFVQGKSSPSFNGLWRGRIVQQPLHFSRSRFSSLRTFCSENSDLYLFIWCMGDLISKLFGVWFFSLLLFRFLLICFKLNIYLIWNQHLIRFSIFGIIKFRPKNARSNESNILEVGKHTSIRDEESIYDFAFTVVGGGGGGRCSTSHAIDRTSAKAMKCFCFFSIIFMSFTRLWVLRFFLLFNVYFSFSRVFSISLVVQILSVLFKLISRSQTVDFSSSIQPYNRTTITIQLST